MDSKKPSVLIAKALYNTVKGYYVALYMVRKDNPLVFKQGQAIANTVIKGDNTRGEIFDEVGKFSEGKGRPKGEGKQNGSN